MHLTHTPALLFPTLTLLLCTCQTQPTLTLQQCTGMTMGTTYEIKIWFRQPTTLPSHLCQTIDSLLHTLDHHFTTYDSTSPLNFINYHQQHTLCIDTALAQVLLKARQIWQASLGTFDPTVGPAVAHQGFGSPLLQTDSFIIGMQYVHIQCTNTNTDTCPCTLTRDTLPIYFDLGGIAKGWAIDQITHFIQTQWQPYRTYVNIGGDLRLAGPGPHPHNRWHIGIAHPHNPLKPILVLQTPATALTTSGAYFQTRIDTSGTPHTHIVNPNNPSQPLPIHHTLSVTVLAETATDADAWATALFAIGCPQIHHFMQQTSTPHFLMLCHSPTHQICYITNITNATFQPIQPIQPCH